MRKTIHAILLLLCAVAFLPQMTSCRKKTDMGMAPKMALDSALSKLYGGDIDGYIECLDFGSRIDTLTRMQVEKMLYMAAKTTHSNKGDFLDYKVTGAEMKGDTVAYVFYKLDFANDTAEVCSEKMVYRDGRWRIRVRN